MHRLISYGLLTVVCGVLTPACGGDTAGERPTTNNPPVGSAGGGGTGGQTGNPGNGGGTSTGMGGSSGGGQTFPAACSGCVEVVVRINPDPMGYTSAQFVIRPANPVDLSTAILTWKIRALTPADVVPPEQMFVTPFATNGSALNYAGAFGTQRALTPANGFTDADTWADVRLDFNRVGPTAPAGETPPAAEATDAGADGGAAGGGGGTTPPPTDPFIVSMIDKTLVAQIGIQVGVTTAFTGSGYVRIAIDELQVEGVDATVFAPRDFNADVGGLVLNDYQVPQGTVAPVARPATP